MSNKVIRITDFLTTDPQVDDEGIFLRVRFLDMEDTPFEEKIYFESNEEAINAVQEFDNIPKTLPESLENLIDLKNQIEEELKSIQDDISFFEEMIKSKNYVWRINFQNRTSEGKTTPTVH